MEAATCSATCGHLGEAVWSGLRVLAGEADPRAGSIRVCRYRGGKAGHEGKGSLFDTLLGQLFIQMGKNEMDISFTPHRKICPGGLDKCERQNYKAFRCLGVEDASVAPKAVVQNNHFILLTVLWVFLQRGLPSLSPSFHPSIISSLCPHIIFF